MARLKLSSLENFTYLSSTQKEIINILDTNKVSIEDLAKMLSPDSDLLHNLFKMINCITHGFNPKLSKLNEAIELVGVSKFRELVLLTLARNIYRNQEILSRSVFTAYCAKEIASRLGLNLNESSEIYAVALLLDLGALFFDLKDPHYISSIYDEESRLVRFLKEQEKYGTDSHSITMSILEEYKLPFNLRKIIGSQKPELNYSCFQLANSILDLAYRLSFVYQSDDSEIKELLNLEHFQKFNLQNLDLEMNFFAKLHLQVQELISL
jgi:HD-like signal output (HDOD) protein